VQELHLTDAGRELLHAADEVIADIEDQITRVLGPGDTAQLRTLLSHVTEAIRDA
jgi:DNA-binding MarR family transcriptional regulator